MIKIKTLKFVPHHYLIRLEGVNKNILDNKDFILSTLLFIANSINCTVIKHDYYQFSPQGLTVFLLLAESHISYHNIVEENRCYIDIFTCSNTMNGLLGVELIKEMIPHEEFYVQYAER